MKPKPLEIALLALIALQAALSLAFPLYRDAGWVLSTWFGNDLVSLVVFVPLFALCIFVGRGLPRAMKLGCFGYAIYNYAFYLFGAELNKLFPLYALILVLAVCALVSEIFRDLEDGSLGAYYEIEARRPVPGIIFLAMGAGLGSVWIGKWFAYAFFGSALPSEPGAFRLVAALDLVLMVAPFLISGICMLRRRIEGFFIGTIVGVQAFLYLLVLCLNSCLMSLKDGSFPGELPIWASLLALEAAGLAFLLAGRRRPPA